MAGCSRLNKQGGAAVIRSGGYKPAADPGAGKGSLQRGGNRCLSRIIVSTLEPESDDRGAGAADRRTAGPGTAGRFQGRFRSWNELVTVRLVQPVFRGPA